MKINRKNQEVPGGFGHLGLILALLLVATIVLVGVKVANNAKNANSSKTLQKVTLQLNWINNAQFAGIYTAREEGFYKDAGLDVTIKEVGDNPNVNADVSSGKVDFGMSTPLEIVLGRDEGLKIKAVAAIQQTSPYVIVARKDAGIKTPADFKGKVLGATGDNPQAKITYAALMATANLKPSDATIKTIDFDILKVFKDNDADTADIYRTDQTYQLKQNNIDFDLVYPEQYGFSIYGDTIIASDSKIAKNPSQVDAFVKASDKGWQYALDHQAIALKHTAKYENALYKDPAYEKFILTSEAPLILPTGGQAIGSMQYIPWNRAYQGVKSAGLLSKPLEVNQLYTTQFVNAP